MSETGLRDEGFGADPSGPDQGSASVLGSLAIRTGVVHVEAVKRDYAVGLLWNSVENPRRAAHEARTMASKEGMGSDFFCIRTEGVPQYGLGSSESGHKAGMPSLAAHIAANKGGTWLGAFKVSGGYYLIAVKDDAVLSEYDRFFESEEEARNFFWDLHAVEIWPEAFAPASWAVDGAEDSPIEMFLDGRPPSKLVNVNNIGRVLRYALIVLGAVGVVFGGIAYVQYRRALEEEARLQEALRLAAEQSRAAAEQQQVVPSPPWEDKPVATEFLAACVDGIQKLSNGVAGWTLKELACHNDNVTALLERSGGTINWVAASVNRDDFRPGIVPVSRDSVVVTWPMASMTKQPKDVVTAKLVDVRRYLLSGFEESFTNATIDRGEGTDFYASLKLSFESVVSPLEYVSLLERVPALVITRASFDPVTSIWTVEGQVHEQLPPPPPPQQ